MNKYLQELMKSSETPIVFDYDGTLFEARWFVKQISIMENTDEALLKAMEDEECLYSEPIAYMRNFVSHRTNTNNLFALSHIHNVIEFEFKCEQLHTYYPKLSKLYWAKSAEDKIKHLEEIYEKYGEFIYIDDNLENLLDFERHFNNPEKCHFFHTSSIFV